MNLTALLTEIDQHLAEAQRIADEVRRRRRSTVEDQLQALLAALLARSGRRRFVQHLVEIEIDRFERQLAGLDLGEVEDVVDDAEQQLAERWILTR